ncbi:ATP synthase F1 subunit gamma [Anaerostipes sp.]|uniref:ATP synthase F1 subunit gamma n=1 Tax=Anaerostipes sp. TaxID=1872530 RepID=UPI0025BA8C57|nr:ATP synthase F1 subunit gamma [Anaerostipes sp.]MBS7008279.1 ATP synthase F1 subunit gamma [Anaerostipes sp.]
MANMTEIRSRMKSIQETMKITNAMYLISSTKLRKAREKLDATAPYFELLQSTIKDILFHSPEISHTFFDQRKKISPEDKKRGYVVMTADKGMAGAYNHNVLKLAEEKLDKGNNNTLFVIGQMGRQYFTKKNVRIDVEFLYTAQDPSMWRARNIAETLVDLYRKEKLDEIYIIYTKMITPLKAEPEIIQILPLKRQSFEEMNVELEKYHKIADYSPSPKVVMDHLVPNYVKGLIYGALVESFSSEQNARMMAMQGATDSARDMIKELSLLYNRARQAAITQEITEIVSGAKAFQKNK